MGSAFVGPLLICTFIIFWSSALSERSCHSSEQENSNLCLTSECVLTSARILSEMNNTVEPCEDFYRFACGNFKPADLERFYSEIKEIEGDLIKLVAEDRSDTDPKHFRLPNALYKACMNESLIKEMGVEPMKEIFHSWGGWPVVMGNNWDSNQTWNWQEIVKQLGYGSEYIFNFFVDFNWMNKTQNILHIDEANFGIYYEHLQKGFNDTNVQDYYKDMINAAVIFGADENFAKADLMSPLQFEMELANVQRSENNFSNIMTVEQVQIKFPFIDWLNFLNDLMPKEITITKFDEVCVMGPKYFENLGTVLKKTSKRTIANYILWRQLNEFKPYLSKPIGSHIGNSKNCYETVIENLPIPLGTLYVQKKINSTLKGIVTEMFVNMRHELFEILSKIEWMDHRRRQAAQDKICNIEAIIGSSDEYTDNNFLEEFFDKLEIDSDQYLVSINQINLFYRYQNSLELRQSYKKGFLQKSLVFGLPANLSASYATFWNTINIPAGFLRGYFFDATRPNYLNYGAIGIIIGHELAHSIFNPDEILDMTENVENLWQNETKNAYLNMTKCFVRQYNNFIDRTTGLNVNGTRTLMENLADILGVQIAYLANKRWVKKSEPKLPALEYTQEQLFWISLGQSWCSKEGKGLLEYRLKNGTHSPNEFRVRGMVSNSKEFANDFGCPKGSPMNPIEKCQVW